MIQRGMGSTGQEMYRKTDLYQDNYPSIFIFLAKLFETCIMGANDDLDGKTTHFYSFFGYK